MPRKKAMSSKKAREVKLRGHQIAREFAKCLGIGKEFNSDPRAKKDVIDADGHSYSVKSGEKKWQIFLYSKTRFESDFIFKGMDGLGDLFLECINSFPEDRNKYLKDRNLYKGNLQIPMRKLCKKLKKFKIRAAFIDKSLFNCGEVDFLAIYENNKFYIFYSREVVDYLAKSYRVENSRARNSYQMDDQKVVFKVNGKTYGEIEMRNDSDVHYREVKFWMDRNRNFNLLKEGIIQERRLGEGVILRGEAIKKLDKYLQKNRDLKNI